MNKMIRFFSLCFLSFSLLLGHAWATDLVVTDAKVPLLPPNVKNAAAYLSIKNNSDKKIELVKVTSSISENAEFHTVIYEDKVSKMKQLTSIMLDKGETLNFSPGGKHIMLVKLLKPLKKGQEIELTFSTKSGTTHSSKIHVGEASGHAHHHHHH